MEKCLVLLKDKADLIKTQGALVFDIDHTLLPPDDSLEQYEDLRNALIAFARAGVTLAFISGSPENVLKNRLIQPLVNRLEETAAERLQIYVNGGSSCFTYKNRQLVPDESFNQENLIDGSVLQAVSNFIASYVTNQLGLKDDALYEDVCRAMDKRREKQWNGKPVQFSVAWKTESWTIDFWDDEQMGQAKIGEGTHSVSFPFINVRGVVKDSNQVITALAGFTPSGFYRLDKASDGVEDLDIREDLLKELQENVVETKEITMRKAGRSSIDITKAGVDKAKSLRHLISTRDLNLAGVIYFGDEFFSGGNDEPIYGSDLMKNGVTLVALNRQEAPPPDMLWLGKSSQSLRDLLTQAGQGFA